jgi:hypothetical protein
MLSFLREQEPEGSSVQNPPSDPAASGPDSNNEAQEQEYLTVAVQEKQVRKSTMLLVVLFVGGLLCLWFMIRRCSPKTVTAGTAGTEETQIETAITRLTGVSSEMFDRMDEVVKKFYEFSDVEQVRVNELAKNPFEIETFLGNLKDPSTAAALDAQAELMTRQQNLQLLSIMRSEQGNYCCMINDKLLYEGDSINGFKVREISDRFVKLGSEDLQIVLKLSE